MSKKERGFEVAKGFTNQIGDMPVRKTKYSAGYDVLAICDTLVPSFKAGVKPVLVQTGIKAYCKDDEYIMIVNRSSNPLKKGLVLANSLGIIDKDYYGNSSNDGHIMFAFYNFSDTDILIKKGDAIGQAIFSKYLLADDDLSSGERTGGFGSTSK